MPRSARLAAKHAQVLFPSRGTPPDRHGYPHYQAMAKANERWRKAYLAELERRRQERARKRRSASAVRAGLASCLGLAIKNSKHAPAPLRFMRGNPIFSGAPAPGTPAWAADLKALWYELPDAAWDGGAIELLVLRPTQVRGPYPGVLLIPDCGSRHFGAQSPESAAREWGCALAVAGFLVVIPKLPGLQQFSSTQNKRRILEGACALGEVVGEASHALDAVLVQPGLAGKRAWIAGRGLGGLAALLLGALDGRAAGVLSDAPLAVGTGVDPDALQIPRFNTTTDLGEIAAALAPRPLGLIAPPFKPRKAAGLAVFRTGQNAQAIEWLKRHVRAINAKPSGGVAVRGERPSRRYAISDAPDLKTWKAWAKRLRREYRAQAGMPVVARPLGVKLIGRTQLADCTREEYHVKTGAFTASNVTFLRPNGPFRRRTTILHLPGSSSDVAKVEREYAHELVAEGWNACIIDARVALYPFHPGIPEGMAMINQSLHDLCCCLDYVAKRDDVDPKRIGTMGVSQGGTHSWMLAAMDDRIAAAAPVCGVCTYRSLWDEWRTEWYDHALLSFLDSHSIYYFTPGVLQLGDQQDLCGLVAPRPFALIGGNHDNCFPLGGMKECDRDLGRLYRLYGKAENFLYYEFEGPHSMPEHSRKAAYAFFRKHL
ncbi:MAG: acetylxylan esterase [Planctomycetes bacterium]|nr:acetylxylan esterase [Planctomycetota bacterium]